MSSLRNIYETHTMCPSIYNTSLGVNTDFRGKHFIINDLKNTIKPQNSTEFRKQLQSQGLTLLKTIESPLLCDPVTEEKGKIIHNSEINLNKNTDKSFKDLFKPLI